MVPTLIVLGLLALGVCIVAFATRRPSTRQDVIVDQDTAWAEPEASTPLADVADPFAHAPLLSPTIESEPIPLERAS